VTSERREIPNPLPADQDALTSFAETPFATLKLKGSLRPYQSIALAAFEADRAPGRRSTHLVAPPSSGETGIGLEVVRRLERPAVVLAPTATVAGQWRDKLALFTEDPASRPLTKAPQPAPTQRKRGKDEGSRPYHRSGACQAQLPFP